jgi:hypothetical protein
VHDFYQQPAHQLPVTQESCPSRSSRTLRACDWCACGTPSHCMLANKKRVYHIVIVVEHARSAPHSPIRIPYTNLPVYSFDKQHSHPPLRGGSLLCTTPSSIGNNDIARTSPNVICIAHMRYMSLPACAYTTTFRINVNAFWQEQHKKTA